MPCPPVPYWWWSFPFFFLTKCACICAVSTCLHHTCGNHIISCWNTWSCLNALDSLYLCLFPLTSFCRSHYTSYSHASVPLFSLLLSILFFFHRDYHYSLDPLCSISHVYTQTCSPFLMNTRAYTHIHTHLSRHLRFLPFSIFERWGIIIILVSVCVCMCEREAYGLPVSYKYQAFFPGNPRPCLSPVYTAEQHVQKKKNLYFLLLQFLVFGPHF